MEIQEGNKKLQGIMSKALVEYNRCVGDINCILKKLYYMNFPCVAVVSLWLIIEFRVFGERFLNVFK